jgi:hypothetical protein
MNRDKYPGSVIPYPVRRASREPISISREQEPAKIAEEKEWDSKWLQAKFAVVQPPKKENVWAPLSITQEPPKESVWAKMDPESMPLVLRLLRWLFPDVNQRRARRYSTPGLVAYYWTGGAPHSYQVGDMSATGLYLLTKERWAPGTLIQMTLQKQGTSSSPEQSICLLSELVRFGANGAGFNFVLKDYEDVGSYGLMSNEAMDRRAVERFMMKIGVRELQS